MKNQSALVTKLTASEVDMCHRRQEIDAEIKRLADERDGLDEKIRLRLEKSSARMGTFRSAIVVEMRPWTRRTLNSKRLRLEQPELAEAYTTVSSGVKPYYV